MSSERKEAIRAYKERTTRRGIYSVRCTASGEVWVGAAPNLDSVQNKIWFMLRQGNHRNTRLQAAWNAHGEPAFQLQTEEELDPDLPPLLVNDELKKRKAHWVTQLGAEALL